MTTSRLFVIVLAPMIAMGCASGPAGHVNSMDVPMSVDRMMVIGNTFEQQGRFREAQNVYQQVLERDPASPAAERLLAVIAAAEVTNAQSLPIERMMAVGEFYERHGEIAIAQGVYTQLLERDPEYEPAFERLKAIADHEVQRRAPSSRSVARNQNSQRQPPTEQAPVVASSPPRQTIDVQQLRAVAVATPKDHRHALVPNLEEQAMDASWIIGSGQVNAPEPEVAEDPQLVQQTNAESTALFESQIPPTPEGVAPVAPRPSPTMAETSQRAKELWQDKPLEGLKASISPNFKESGGFRDSEKQRLNLARPLMVERGSINQLSGEGRTWMLSNYEWEAPATRHLPLWFEEPNVERMGYTYGLYWNICGYESGPHAAECLQPFVSAAHFWGRVPLVPYIWGVDPPLEPVYTLGVDRPGSPVPYRKHLAPISLKGAMYQAAAIVGLAYILP